MDEKILEQLKEGLVFLSMPYSSEEDGVPQDRYESALRLVNYLMSKGIHVLSPIITGHPVVERFDTPAKWEYWSRYCERCIKASKFVLVYQLKGFDSSIGVEGELKIAKALGKEIIYIDEDFNFVEPVVEAQYPGFAYGDFHIDELNEDFFKSWVVIYNQSANIEDVKSMMLASMDAVRLKKSLAWE